MSRLLEEARQEEPDFSRVARLIGGDVALAAAVLKMANSPFFGLRRKIQSVKQAAAVLGLRNLLKIIYGVVLKQSLGGAKAPAMRRFSISPRDCRVYRSTTRTRSDCSTMRVLPC